MPAQVQQARPVGFPRLLDLGADPAQSPALTLADGVRVVEAGAVHSRPGRVRAGLSFPAEGTEPALTFDHFRILDLRGLGVFYDQRVETRPTPGGGPPTTNLPERLNYIFKAGARLWINDRTVQPTLGIYTGDGTFQSGTTRAKFVTYGDKVYIIDESTPPKVMQRKLIADQTQNTIVKYDIRRMGVVYPTATTQVPALSYIAFGSTALHKGTYRVRLILENKHGVFSNPTVTASHSFATAPASGYLYIDWSALTAGFPSEATKVRIYVSFVDDTVSEAQEPSAFYFWKSVTPTSRDDGADALGSARFFEANRLGAQTRPIMGDQNGAPPKLKDMVIIGDVAYGIAMPDVVYREGIIADGGRRIVGDTVQPPSFENFGLGRGLPNTRGFVRSKRYDSTEIKLDRVDSSYLMVSEPGQPEYMENWVRVSGDNSEIMVGLAPLGDNCVVFTNLGIKIYDPETQSLKSTPAKVGCLSRDSIVTTDGGIRFIGSDGVPRLFNGATVEEVTTELLPLFDRDDYLNEPRDYLIFDKQNAALVSCTEGDRKFFMTYPVTENPTLPSYDTSATGPMNLAIGDASRGQTLWSVDRDGYSQVLWLGRESRLLAIDTAGFFYFIEEGTEDQVASGNQPIPFRMATKKFASASGQQGRFLRIKVDANTSGETMTLYCRVDDDNDLSFSTTFSNLRRAEFATDLPGNFMGRYMTVYLLADVANVTFIGRVAVYNVSVEADVRGVF